MSAAHKITARGYPVTGRANITDGGALRAGSNRLQIHPSARQINGFGVLGALAAQAVPVIPRMQSFARRMHLQAEAAIFGAPLIPHLSRAFHIELPELKGFSERNIKRMVAFYRTYPSSAGFLPQPAAELTDPIKVMQSVAQMDTQIKAPQAAALFPDTSLRSILSGQHVILIEKVKGLTSRLWRTVELREETEQGRKLDNRARANVKEKGYD